MENGRHSYVTPELQSENLGFSTFFSTVVENFGETLRLSWETLRLSQEGTLT